MDRRTDQESRCNNLAPLGGGDDEEGDEMLVIETWVEGGKIGIAFCQNGKLKGAFFTAAKVRKFAADLAIAADKAEAFAAEADARSGRMLDGRTWDGDKA